MEFVSAEGACALVDEASAGQRLQAFACRAFREQLGRNGGQLHSACKRAAQDEASRGGLLVNSQPCAGRQILRAGDLVTLVNSRQRELQADPPGGRAAVSGGRARMDYGARSAAAMEGLEDAGALASHSAESTRGTSAARAFGAYYEAQRLCSLEAWRDAEAAFARPLPLCVRLNASVPSHVHALAGLQEVFGPRLMNVSWAPNAWRLRSQLVEDDASCEASVSRATQLLLQAQSCGELALQEVAAMLPALALCPQPGHTVLDLCAAPGGKTLQLLDIMIANSFRLGLCKSDRKDDGVTAPSFDVAVQALQGGLVISNDVSRQRQERTLRRSHGLLCIPLVVTSADAAKAEFYVRPPSLPCVQDELLLFDRVLCDVPCGGDGTLRKSPDKLSRFSVRTGLRNHTLQLDILRNGLRMLKPGGILVYSTCSLDPVQNEAVVRAALELESPRDATSRKLKLLSLNEAFPNSVTRALRCDSGLVRWRVPHPDFENNGLLFSSWADVPLPLRREQLNVGRSAADMDSCADDEQIEADCLLAPSMFPSCMCDEDSEWPLQNCVRLLPSHDDCGGFFVAVLQRTHEVADEAPTVEIDGRADAMCVDTDASIPEARLPAAEPWLPAPDAALLRDLWSFFGLSGGPAEAWSVAVASRDAAGDPALLVLVPDIAGRLLRPTGSLCDGVGDSSGIGLVGAGLPLFGKMPVATSWWPALAPWRICQEAAHLVAAIASRRVLRCVSSGAAVELLCQRRTSVTRLRTLVSPSSLASCGSPNGELQPGAVALTVPGSPSSTPGEVSHAEAVAALLDDQGLLLLAPADVLERYAERCRIATTVLSAVQEGASMLQG